MIKTHCTHFFKMATRKLKLTYDIFICIIFLMEKAALSAVQRHQKAETGFKPRSSHPKGCGLILILSNLQIFTE